MLLNKGFESSKINFIRSLSSIVEAIFEWGVLFGDHEADLLNRRQLPIMRTSLEIASAHGLFEVCFDVARNCCKERIDIHEHTIEIWRLQRVSFVKAQDAEQTIQVVVVDFCGRNVDILNQRLPHVLFGDFAIEVMVEELEGVVWWEPFSLYEESDALDRILLPLEAILDLGRFAGNLWRHLDIQNLGKAVNVYHADGVVVHEAE